MPFSDITYPEELSVLTEALRLYCLEAHIEPKSPDYYDAGKRAMMLYLQGISPEELAEAMRSGDLPSTKRYG
ncbi:MAG: hypothetical protein KF694_21785 [Mesorhizobium sp.]|nr:hypothetical protein [Mesorhizobium sp.]